MKSATTGKLSGTDLAKLQERSDREIDVADAPYNAHSAQDVSRFWANATVMFPRLRGQRGPQRAPTKQLVSRSGVKANAERLIPASQRPREARDAKAGALGRRLTAKGKPVSKRA